MKSVTSQSQTHRPVSPMHLPTIDRSIREENRLSLLRRWQLARTDAIVDPRVMARWFPSQNALFEILSVLTEEQVIEMADCGVPLFTVRVPVVQNECAFLPLKPANELETECLEEIFMSLMSRLDALRTSFTQACLLFDLSNAQARFISRHSPRELQAVAGDAATAMIPAPSDQFFTLSAMSPITTSQRTVLAATTRRVRTFSY